MHVFDAAKVEGNLTVRRARDGETVLALDQREYKLGPNNVVISDEKGIESIGGIMGGEHSGCDENTTDVLIESALWDPMNIAKSGRTLGIITADCAPVLFQDAEAGVIGAAHAGWKGAVVGVLEATIAAMEALGASRARISAVVGPCIAQASYEVRADLRDAVGDARFFAPGRDEAHFQFDLAGYCTARLAAAGVTAAALGVDTLGDEARFFSHRRRTLSGGGPLGHQISAIIAALAALLALPACGDLPQPHRGNPGGMAPGL
eukprot:gene51487-62963_t